MKECKCGRKIREEYHEVCDHCWGEEHDRIEREGFGKSIDDTEPIDVLDFILTNI